MWRPSLNSEPRQIVSFHTQERRVKPRPAPLVVAIVLVIVIVTGGVVYALLTQTLPSTTIPPSTVSSSCQSLQTSSVVTASSGAIKYTCPTGPAFTTIAGTSTPDLSGFSLCGAQVVAPCYSNFGYMASSDTTDCVAGSIISAWFHPIANQTAVTFTAGSWDYCAFYAATSTGGTLPGFSISWSP